MSLSRCDGCGRRIAPGRYELGLCARCERVCSFVTAIYAVAVLKGLIDDPRIAELIRRVGDQFSSSIAAAAGTDGPDR